VHWPGLPPTAALTELEKATYAAQVLIECVGLDICCLWNETFQTQVNRPISLLRNTFTADPIPPTQPEIIYYVQRTLCTLLGDTRPVDLPVAAAAGKERLRIWCFRREDGSRLAAIWAVKQQVTDPPPRLDIDITIGLAGIEQVVGIDLLNGRERELAVRRDGDIAVVPSLVVSDFPVLLRF